MVTLIAEDSGIVVLSMLKEKEKEKAKKVNQLSWGLPWPVKNVKFSGKGSMAFADSIKFKQLEFLISPFRSGEIPSVILQYTGDKNLNVAQG